MIFARTALRICLLLSLGGCAATTRPIDDRDAMVGTDASLRDAEPDAADGAETPLPRITAFAPAFPALGQPLVLTVEDLGDDHASALVTFDDQPIGGVSPTSSSPTALTVMVPSALTGINLPGDSKVIAVRVTVGGRRSAPRAIEIYML